MSGAVLCSLSGYLQPHAQGQWRANLQPVALCDIFSITCTRNILWQSSVRGFDAGFLVTAAAAGYESSDMCRGSQALLFSCCAHILAWCQKQA
ncbi:hypothetical protein QQF64_011612 [Cirrhinus molitorella]|uniref:Uncharacterized protein n=1 Tax=Cirrhinus molitorella TaxID=172907 RepID=A0ABR3LZR9_9TELE